MTSPVAHNPANEMPAPVANAHLAAILAWLLPGAGHFYLGRRARALAFAAVVLVSLVVGCALQGRLWQVIANQPLSILATLGSMGMGAPYFVLRYLLRYEGVITEQSFEYGSAFILTAGLMNLLLVLDAWDIARGKKE